MGFIDKITSTKGSYQDKRSSNDDNWEMIATKLSGSNNLLDVACDAGFYSIKAAKLNLFVFGFDILTNSLKKARKKAKEKGVEGSVVFMEMSISPENIRNLPVFDSILCLSVFHHFVRLHGENNAKAMVVDLFSKSAKSLFLQIPSKIGKYNNKLSIDFNGRKDLVDRYIRDIFVNVDSCEVVYLGKKVEKPPTEEYRFLYQINKHDN